MYLERTVARRKYGEAEIERDDKYPQRLGLPAVPSSFSTKPKPSTEMQSIKISLTGLRLAQRMAEILFRVLGGYGRVGKQKRSHAFSLLFGIYLNDERS